MRRLTWWFTTALRHRIPESCHSARKRVEPVRRMCVSVFVSIYIHELVCFFRRISRTTKASSQRCGNARASPINTTWKMIYSTNKAFNVLCYIFALHCVRNVLCSEFPERECCDTVYSALPNPEPAPTIPTLLTQVIPSTITVNHTGNYLYMLHVPIYLSTYIYLPTYVHIIYGLYIVV